MNETLGITAKHDENGELLKQVTRAFGVKGYDIIWEGHDNVIAKEADCKALTERLESLRATIECQQEQEEADHAELFAGIEERAVAEAAEALATHMTGLEVGDSEEDAQPMTGTGP